MVEPSSSPVANTRSTVMFFLFAMALAAITLWLIAVDDGWLW